MRTIQTCEKEQGKKASNSRTVRKSRGDSFYIYFQEALEEKMTELGIGEHIREGAGHYKETRDRGR